MMTCGSCANPSFSCGGNPFEASFDTRNHTLLDTALALVVSIYVFQPNVRVILPSA